MRVLLGVALISVLLLLAASVIYTVNALRDSTLPVRIAKEDVNWSVHQIEVEVFKLHLATMQTDLSQKPVFSLSLKYDVLLSRTDMFKAGELHQVVRTLPETSVAVDEIIKISESLEPLVSKAEAGDAVARTRLISELMDLRKKAHALTLTANQELVERKSQERQHLARTFLIAKTLFGVLILTVLVGFFSLFLMVVRAEKATREADYHRQEAEANNQAKSRFLSNISHELRTPLNAIMGYSELLRMEAEGLDPEQQANIAEISIAGEHLLSLINDILDLSKIENGKLTISLAPVSVLSMLNEALPYVRSLAADNQVIVNPPTDETDYMIRVDRTRMVQVLINLLSNAVKYNRKGGMVNAHLRFMEMVGESELAGAEPAKILRITIEDTGIGIKKELQEKLFQPFSRLAGDVTIEGTGIGLVLSQHLVSLMHGEIGFRSAEGVGSEFWVDFPIYRMLQKVDTGTNAGD